MTDRNTETFADAGEEKVAALLRTLPSVNAPTDFDFRVRARIAKGRPVVKNAWTPRLARVAVPAVLLVGIGGYFGTGMFRQPEVSPQVAETNVVPQQPVASTQIDHDALVVVAPPRQEAPRQEVAQTAVKPQTPENPTMASTSKKKTDVAVKPTPAGGSYEEAVTEPKTLIQKRLSDLGVKQRGSTIVSAPASSGFKTGDVIISSSLSSVTIRRDGKTVQIALK